MPGKAELKCLYVLVITLPSRTCSLCAFPVCHPAALLTALMSLHHGPSEPPCPAVLSSLPPRTDSTTSAVLTPLLTDPLPSRLDPVVTPGAFGGVSGAERAFLLYAAGDGRGVASEPTWLICVRVLSLPFAQRQLCFRSISAGVSRSPASFWT